MSRVISFAGEMELKFSEMHRSGEQLVIEATLGVWPSKIYFQPEEILPMLRLMLNRSTVSYVLLLPFALIKRRFQPRGGAIAEQGSASRSESSS